MNEVAGQVKRFMRGSGQCRNDMLDVPGEVCPGQFWTTRIPNISEATGCLNSIASA
jgi:hypothetical protein